MHAMPEAICSAPVLCLCNGMGYKGTVTASSWTKRNRNIKADRPFRSLAQVFVGQEHHVTGKNVHGNVVDFVRLTADAEIEWMPGVTDGKVKIVMTVTSPDGKTVLTVESGTMDPLTNSAPGG